MRLAVFASGGGSNFQAILDAIKRGELQAEPVLCLSNSNQAGALKRAEVHHIPTVVLNPSSYDSVDLYTSQLLETLDTYKVDFIALAGYLRKIPAPVVTAFKGRITNIHPSLLPAFGGKGMYGKRVHQAVLDYGVRWTGVTIHLVDEEYDSGPIILQEPVPVLPNDTVETLATRVLKVEHKLYPQALQLFAENRIELCGRKVIINTQNHAYPDS